MPVPNDQIEKSINKWYKLTKSMALIIPIAIVILQEITIVILYYYFPKICSKVYLCVFYKEGQLIDQTVVYIFFLIAGLGWPLLIYAPIVRRILRVTADNLQKRQQLLARRKGFVLTSLILIFLVNLGGILLCYDQGCLLVFIFMPIIDFIIIFIVTCLGSAIFARQQTS